MQLADYSAVSFLIAFVFPFVLVFLFLRTRQKRCCDATGRFNCIFYLYEVSKKYKSVDLGDQL